MTEKTAGVHQAQADGDPNEAEGVQDWYLIGKEDASAGIYDPPNDAADRVTYESGQQSAKDASP